MAIMQSFSNKAQRIHGLMNSNDDYSFVEPTTPDFFILPPLHVLESLLRACLGCYEPYYPFLSTAMLKPNELLEKGSNPVVRSLKLLLMLAGGAMTTDASSTYHIVHGLLEICRMTLSNLIEADMKLARS